MKMSDNEVRKSVETFLNRRRYDDISPKILATIPDDQIVQTIIDYIDTKIVNKREKLIEIQKMASGFQTLYSTWILENEVNNGGFNQFFVNSSGQFAEMALRSFQKLNATEYYELLENAITIFKRENHRNPFKRLFAKKSVKAFVNSYKESSLEICDYKFVELGENLSTLRIQYIRTHLNEFLD